MNDAVYLIHIIIYAHTKIIFNQHLITRVGLFVSNKIDLFAEFWIEKKTGLIMIVKLHNLSL